MATYLPSLVLWRHMPRKSDEQYKRRAQTDITLCRIAEMASMYPISGGQYYWTALLAPPRHAKFLSWLTGWLSTLGWQAAASTGTYLGGTIIQSLIVPNDANYEPQRWQATPMLIAVLLLTLFVNTVLINHSQDLKASASCSMMWASLLFLFLWRV